MLDIPVDCARLRAQIELAADAIAGRITYTLPLKDGAEAHRQRANGDLRQLVLTVIVLTV